MKPCTFCGTMTNRKSCLFFSYPGKTMWCYKVGAEVPCCAKDNCHVDKRVKRVNSEKKAIGYARQSTQKPNHYEDEE